MCWGGVGHALGSNSITLRLGPGYKAEWGWGGPVGPVRAEWGCGGVGHALGFTLAEEAKWGRVGPVRGVGPAGPSGAC